MYIQQQHKHQTSQDCSTNNSAHPEKRVGPPSAGEARLRRHRDRMPLPVQLGDKGGYVGCQLLPRQLGNPSKPKRSSPARRQRRLHSR
eukprot:scaffold62736_cov18-Prasinocladus_malaysianus.AAC.1